MDISPHWGEETTKGKTTLFKKCVELADFIKIPKFYQIVSRVAETLR